MKFKPLSDRLVIKPEPVEETTKGGIILPGQAQEKPTRGTVVAVGPGKKDEPTKVQIGDVVLYGKSVGTKTEIEDEDYLIIREADVIGVL